MDKKIINTSHAPDPIGPYSQAVKANGMLFISGQVAIKPGTSELITDNIQKETEQVMSNLKAILNEAGLEFEHVLKTTIFLKDMSLFTSVNEVYGKFFNLNFPARETVAVKGLPKDVNVEISMIAAE
ncbi:RidA family protein [Ginsengibacter hankyongi]|uniref:RidA family protein n=1 Tax=Ginsengibacter hankyongi TaxID=2607284 RepID=A0A5J5INS8_9BACT|nr:RidA family protein [Ginsengibacter hankyongi]KAA9042178.1 RidA family protein [Ginsengibacter hankyongi]